MSATNEFQQLLASGEELLPELQPYLGDAGGFDALRHPLIYSVPHFPMLNALLNRAYLDKLEKLDKYRQDRNWTSCVFSYERPYRLGALLALESELSNQEYWELLSEVYVDTENLQEVLESWRQSLNSARAGREYFMNEDERSVLSSSPELIQVYRGVQHEEAIRGFSWTRCRATARMFASRTPRRTGYLVEGFAKKSDVLGYLARRGEDEIVIEGALVSDITMTILQATGP